MDILSQAAEYADMSLVVLLTVLFIGSLGAFEVGNISLLRMLLQMVLIALAIKAIYNHGLFRRMQYIWKNSIKK